MALSADDMMAQLVLDAFFAGAAGWSHDANRAFLSCMLGEVRPNEKTNPHNSAPVSPTGLPEVGNQGMTLTENAKTFEARSYLCSLPGA